MHVAISYVHPDCVKYQHLHPVLELSGIGILYAV